MSLKSKIKNWLDQNPQLVQGVTQNKYVGMLYDRFASLPAKQQQQVLIGGLSLTGLFLLSYLSYSYFSLFSYSKKASDSYLMVNLLQQYQKSIRDQSDKVQAIERNNELAGLGGLKQYLIDQAKNSGISPRMVQAEEREESQEKVGELKGKQDVKIKRATVKLEKINLKQLKLFLENIEFGRYNISLSSMRVSNDEKIRGYMNLEIGVLVYLFVNESTEA